jgi:hypothetical protein
MRIGGLQATGAEIRHSRWPSWCAVLFEKSDVRKKMWSGQRSGRGLLAKPTNRPVIIYIRFFMYESYHRKIVKPTVKLKEGLFRKDYQVYLTRP